MNNRKILSRSDPTPRPPTLMIDLLFGVLILFAFMMGSPHSQDIISEQLKLPTTEKTDVRKKKKLFPIYPIRTKGSGWRYRTGTGRLLTPRQLKSFSRRTGKKPVLVAKRDTLLQEYIDALLPLKKAGMKNIGITVVSKQKGKSK